MGTLQKTLPRPALDIETSNLYITITYNSDNVNEPMLLVRWVIGIIAIVRNRDMIVPSL